MTYIPNKLRQFVTERAGRRCEYCHYPLHASLFTFEIEHIISEKHGGESTSENLALSCPYCNRAKGSDLGSIDKMTGNLTPFFNPRINTWEDHFTLAESKIMPLTDIGRVTESIFQFNSPERILERQKLIESGLY